MMTMPGPKAFSRLISLLTVLFVLYSCGTDTDIKPNGPIDTPEIAEYEFSLSGKQLIGQDVDSQWKPDDGLVWLSTDDKHEDQRELFGTLTLFIGPPIFTGSEVLTVSSALLSTTDKLVGTGPELNGKLYSYMPESSTADCEHIEVVAATGSFIKVNYICMHMQEVNTGEVIKVRGSFTALAK
jgi:hypothetical protein